MIITNIFSHLNDRSRTQAPGKATQLCLAACVLFLDNKPQLQETFLSGVLLSGYQTYGFSIFSSLARLFIAPYWAHLSGEKPSYIEEFIEFVGEQLEAAEVGRNFTDWQEYDQEFALKLARRIVSSEQSEQDGLWMLDRTLVDALRDQSHEIFQSSNGQLAVLERELKRVAAEAKAHPLNILSWRLQLAVDLKFDVDQETSLNFTSEALAHSERLTALLALFLDHRSEQGTVFLPASPVTAAQMLAAFRNHTIQHDFDVELLEKWLTGNVGALSESFFEQTCAEAKALDLLFQIPVRLSPSVTKNGFGLTRRALQITEPFHKIITKAILR